MSVDRSLRMKSSLARHRNVLSRAERVAILKSSGGWDDSRSPLGLPKVSHRKPKAGKKAKKEAAPAGETPAAAPAAAAKPAK
ncbi:MAG: small basic protein [Phycisphaerae bacterium]|jgi:small basic protein (TIGR04137 family)|nr:small basic protein [Phycisphaerae bacterium]MCZ2399510.1 small basic protein [Phycisphaerae bacterium]NUQ48882.1 small basic protein [Phycisphaerae bacterium]